MNKRKVSDFFNDYAEGFDAIYGERNTLLNRAVNAMFRRSMKLRFELTMEGCDPIDGRSVLDIGCGGGHFSVCLARSGAAKVVGIDFAEEMLTLARSRAERSGVSDLCAFELADFDGWETSERFDYAVLMGFMDYIADPQTIIERALSLTTRQAFFSFPVGSGFLAWQRRMRYRSKCDLYMYDREQIGRLFETVGGCDIEIQRISRDYFVTASV